MKKVGLDLSYEFTVGREPKLVTLEGLKVKGFFENAS